MFSLENPTDSNAILLKDSLANTIGRVKILINITMSILIAIILL